MAVIQISKIQHRRGKKHEGSGMPQLASGELGWAIDTRELFIGNGSVSEGAPEIGNTKVITEHDNLFDLPNQYVFENGSSVQTGEDALNPTFRTLQSRLDDAVYVENFGAVGDGITNSTDAINRAIRELYVEHSDDSLKRTLVFGAGEYVVNDPIYLPPYITLVGQGVDNTTITQTKSGEAVFVTVDDTGYPTPMDDSYITQCRNIHISNLTVKGVSGSSCVIIENCRDSVFENLLLVNSWSNGDGIVDAESGIYFSSNSSAVGSHNNRFSNIVLINCSNGVFSDDVVEHNVWHNCQFKELGRGIVFGKNSVSTGPNYNTISECSFNSIDAQGVWINYGTENVSRDNRYQLVGNDGGNDYSPVSSILVLDDGNHSFNDRFSRTTALMPYTDVTTGIGYVPEIVSRGFYEYSYTGRTVIPQSPYISGFIRLPYTGNQSYIVEYSITGDSYVAKRVGRLYLNINEYTVPYSVQMIDDYSYTGDDSFEDYINFTSEYDSDMILIDFEFDDSGIGSISAFIEYTVLSKNTNV